jgi:uncharacterized membrane protein
MSKGRQVAGPEGTLAMMYGFGHGGGWPIWADALMWLGMIILLGLLVWAVSVVVTSVTRRPGADASSAAQILDERLARGEIDVGEHARLREALASGNPQRPADAGNRT